MCLCAHLSTGVSVRSVYDGVSGECACVFQCESILHLCISVNVFECEILVGIHMSVDQCE